MVVFFIIDQCPLLSPPLTPLRDLFVALGSESWLGLFAIASLVLFSVIVYVCSEVVWFFLFFLCVSVSISFVRQFTGDTIIYFLGGGNGVVI